MSYDSEIAADSPALYLRLQETGTDHDGDAWPDTSGNGLDAIQVYTGASDPARGFPSPIESDASSFDFFGWTNSSGAGVNRAGTSRLRVPNNALIQPSGDFTLECWVRPEEGMYAAVDIDMVGKQGTCGVQLAFGGASGEHLAGFVIDSAGTRYRAVDTSFDFESFIGTSFFCVVRRIGNTLSFKVNDALRAVTAISSGLGTNVNSNDFFVHHPSGSHFAAGRYTKVAFFTSGLSDDRTLAHYEAAFNENPLIGRADLHLTAKLDGEASPATLVFPFRHNWSTPVRETFEWSTDVMPAEQDYEQRAAVRQRPRRTLEYDILIPTNDLRRRFRAFLFRNQGNAVYLPIWTDLSALESDADASSTSLDFDSTDCDFDDGARLLLFQDEAAFEMCEIDAVGDDSTALLAATVDDWKKGAMVAPLRRALIDSTAQISMLTGSVEQTVLSCRVLAQDVPLEPRRNGTYTPRYTYKDVEVFDPAILGGNNWREPAHGESSIRSVEPDTPGGIFSRDPQDTAARDLISHSILLASRAAIMRFLAWAFIRQGRRVPLWVPTLRDDFTAVSVATITGGSTLTVAGHGYTDFYQTHAARRDVALVYKDGTMVFRRISKATVSGDNDLLTFTGQSAPSLTNLYTVSFLKFARLNEDTLTLLWRTGSVAEVTVNFFDLLTTPD